MAPTAQTSLISAQVIEAQAPDRVYSVDLLRGLIMVIMALDHVREYMTNVPFAPSNLSRTWPTLFLTRWITHFCAPWFCFLAGTSAYLAMSRGKSLEQKRSLLWKRGVFLIIFEWVVMMFGWTFLPFPQPIALVLWMLGCSMIVLAALTRLPLKWIAGIGVAIIGLHNLTDPIKPAVFGHFAWLWNILHVPGVLGPKPPHLLFGRIPVVFPVFYPLLPWPGVMAAGYAFGTIMKKPAIERRKICLWLGAGCIALFLLLRATNFYGNPHTPSGTTSGDFHTQSQPSMTLVAFLDTQKYPPSLQFLLMTLGPGFLALAAFDQFRTNSRGLRSRATRFFLVYGRVPMFYYVLQAYFIHLLAILIALAVHQPVGWLFGDGFFYFGAPKGYGYGLPVVYVVWITSVLLLYLPCRWYMALKKERHDWWMHYI